MLSVLTSYLPYWAIATVSLVAVVVLYGAAALWAAGGRGGWLARVAPVVLLLAALAPLGAYELIVLFGCQVLTVVGLLVGGRIWGAFRLARRAGASREAARSVAFQQLAGEGPRFGLSDLLQAVLLAAAALAIVRFATPWISMTAGPREWAGLVLVGAVLGEVTILADWLVFGRSWLRLRMTLATLAAIGSALLLWRLLGTDLAVAAMGMSALVGILALARLSGWDFSRRSDLPWAAEGPTAGAAQSERPWLRLVAQGVIGLVAIAGLFALVSIYRALLPPTLPQPSLPMPNGHDELVKLARQVNWSAIPTQDFEAVPLAACRTFVADNADALAGVRKALAMPSRVPVVYDPTYLTAFLPDIQQLRVLNRALAAEARLADAEGRHADAAGVYLDCVQLGDAAARGGLLVHELVGIAIRSTGLQGLARQLPHLTATELSELQKRLQQSSAAREPFAELLVREKMSAATSYPWMLRLTYQLDDSMIKPAIDASQNARLRSDAQLLLVETEAAVRHYTLEHGAPPELLSELVPMYFETMRIDPYSDRPLVYRRTADGYLLYSVGINGRDDGGTRATLSNATTSVGSGDLFFDAKD